VPTRAGILSTWRSGTLRGSVLFGGVDRGDHLALALVRWNPGMALAPPSSRRAQGPPVHRDARDIPLGESHGE
jgi:hypothetical protein